MPPPSSAISITTSLPTWRTVSEISPVSDLPAARRASTDSMPWSSALRRRCSSGPTSFSRTERSSSTCAPWISRLARLSSSFAVVRMMRYRRSDRLAKGTVRIENRRCCTSRDRRACASKAASASSKFLSNACCTVDTSLMPSASERVSSWNRVKRSNSSGSKSPCAGASLLCDWICDSAWISISRICERKRITLLVSSRRLVFSVRSSPSTRARAIATSPASLTRRSIVSARTRSWARGPASISGTASARAGAATGGVGDGGIGGIGVCGVSGTTTGRSATGGAGCGDGVTGSGVRSGAASCTWRAVTHGKSTSTSPRRRPSSTKAMRSRSSSSASKSCGPAASLSSSSRDSMRCAS